MPFAHFHERFGIGWARHGICYQAGVQPGMPLSRPMPSVAPGVAELRLHDEDGQYRTFYYTASAEGILVFHAFSKKTRQTPPAEIQLGRRRLKELIDEQS